MLKKMKVKAQPFKKTVSAKMNIDYKIPLSDYHPGHDMHMCRLLHVRNMKTAAALAKDAQYLCFICGRAAKKKEHLCEPVAI